MAGMMLFDEVLKANPYHDRLGRFASAPGGGAGGAVGHNGVTTKEQDKAYMAAVEAGDMETAQRMVLETAKAVGANTFANPDTTAYSIRRGPEPQTTVTAYKTFFVDDQGNPSALFVEGTERLPVGVWLDAKDAYHFQADNGKMYTPSRKNPNSDGSGKTGASIKIPNDQVRQELIDQGFLPEGSTAGAVTALAYRPGWHAGDLPFFPQGGKQGNPEYSESGAPNKRYDPSKPATNYANIHRRNQVVFEVEMAADVDYTKSTSIKSGANKGKIKYTDMQEMPTDGYYKFATNPMTNANDLGNWYISGSLKIKRALTQQECDTILGKNGFKPQEWEGGKLDLDKLNYNPNKTDRGTKLLDPVTYDNNGKVIPLSQRFDNSSDDVRKGDEEEQTFSIFKTDEEKRLVFGWASVAITLDGKLVEDHQNDVIDPEDLEEAAYEYVLSFRDTGEEHVSSLRKKGKMVESCVFTEEKQRAMGLEPGALPIGWWIGFKITDDEAWEKVKNGTYKMFSIEGKANRVPVEKALRNFEEFPGFWEWLEENMDATKEDQQAAMKYYGGKTHKKEREKGVAKTFDEILNVGQFDTIVEVEKGDIYHIVEIEKFNPYHDSKGRFASAQGATSFTYSPGKSKAHDNAIARAKEEENRRANRTYAGSSTKDAADQIKDESRYTINGKKNSLDGFLDENGNLTPEREATHREIIDKLLTGKVPVEGQATMTMLGGGPASGKSSVMNPDTSRDKHAVTIDPDMMKSMLPGYSELAKTDTRAADFYHEESSLLAKRFAATAYSENYNAVFDGTGDGSNKSVQKKIQEAKSAGYRVEAKYVSIDTDEAVRRNQKRYDDAVAKGETPRLPPVEMVRATHTKCTDISVDVAAEFDHIEIWDNNGARGQQKMIATGGSGKGLMAVAGQEAAFDRYLSKGAGGLESFATRPDGTVIHASRG